MKKQWAAFIAWIEGLSRRERLMVLVATVVCMWAMFDVLFLTPLLESKRELAKRIDAGRQQITVMQDQIRTLQSQGAADPDAANRARLAELQDRLRDVDAQLDQLRREMVSPEQMTQVLESVLQKRRQLKLVSLKTLPVSPLIPSSEPAPEATTASRATSPEVAVFRHGVEITVEGRYLDLLEYLSDLERSPWQLMWGNASVRAERYPNSTLTVTVYTLSLDKTWLSI